MMLGQLTSEYNEQYLRAIQISKNWFNYPVQDSGIDLETYLYAEWYSKQEKNTKQHNPQAQQILVNALNAAIRISVVWQSGWSCKREIDSTYIEAEKNSQSRILCAFDYINLSTPGKTPLKNTPLKVLSHNVSDKLMEGYWVTHTHNWQQSTGKILRVYWNIDIEAAASLVSELFKLMPDNKEYSLKLPLESAGYMRTDAAVLYFYARDIQFIMPAIKSASQKLKEYLYDGIPCLTKSVTKGVGLAEEPLQDEQSFGISRCKILSQALKKAHKNNIDDSNKILSYIYSELLAAQVDPLMPYRSMIQQKQGRRNERTNAAIKL